MGMPWNAAPRLGGLTMTPVHGFMGPGDDTPIASALSSGRSAAAASAHSAGSGAGRDHRFGAERNRRRPGDPFESGSVGRDDRRPNLGATQVKGENGPRRQHETSERAVGCPAILAKGDPAPGGGVSAPERAGPTCRAA